MAMNCSGSQHSDRPQNKSKEDNRKTTTAQAMDESKKG
jgi:hypothetical protein